MAQKFCITGKEKNDAARRCEMTRNPNAENKEDKKKETHEKGEREREKRKWDREK
jgi:hypothetical protein